MMAGFCCVHITDEDGNKVEASMDENDFRAKGNDFEAMLAGNDESISS